ncbi:MAG: MTH1187 family thiamine-binding protein [Spirochaetaceae bacterium]
MSVLMEFAMFPTDKGTSVSAEVSKIIAMVRESGHPYTLSPMGTTVETETMEEATSLLNRASKILEPDSERVYSSVKFDIRKGKSNRLEGKIASVEEKIGKVRGSSLS